MVGKKKAVAADLLQGCQISNQISAFLRIFTLKSHALAGYQIFWVG